MCIFSTQRNLFNFWTTVYVKSYQKSRICNSSRREYFLILKKTLKGLFLMRMRQMV